MNHSPAAVRRASPGDRAQVEALLRNAGLPLDGVGEHFARFYVAEREGKLVGAIGSERYDGVALLRSAAVDDAERGSGVGTRLVEHLLDALRGEGVQSVWLLTTTAEAYFPRFGFCPVPRAEVPGALNASAELRGACPASAIVMSLPLA